MPVLKALGPALGQALRKAQSLLKLCRSPKLVIMRVVVIAVMAVFTASIIVISNGMEGEDKTLSGP